VVEGLQVSVVLPVHNEREALPLEIERLRQSLDWAGHTFEILVVDDASTDGSAEIAASYASEDPRVRLIRMPYNRGSGSARREGTRAARGNFVVWTDADMTYPNEEIPRLIKSLKDADQVIGARTSEEGTWRPLRRFGKRLVRSLASYLVDYPIPDLNSGLRAFRREAIVPYLPLLPKGFSCVSTATLAFIADDRVVRFEPISYSSRSGRSKFRILQDSYRLVLQVVGIALYYSPLRAFLPVAGALLALGAGKLVYDLAAHPVRVAANTLLIFLVGFNVLAVGLLADVVVRARRWPRPPSDET
jgi:glycosyltransferase involved in cell wall biosynthesis